MTIARYPGMVLFVVAALAGFGCDTSMQSGLNGNQTAATALPDGFDPTNPCVERSTLKAGFDGVRTIRVELPTGRVSVSQAEGDTQAVIKVSEMIVAKGQSNDILKSLLSGSAVTAERSFVDETRLDIKATIASGLADTDIVFDVRLVIPSGANVEIFLGNGTVEVTSLQGNLEVRTANGPITITKVTGNIIAETTQRPIEITDVTGNVSALTDTADITLRLTPPANGRVSATTANGNISMTIAKATAASLELSAPEGGAVNANLSGFTVADVLTGDGFLSGILNGGGGQIEAKATAGEITLVGM